MLLSGKVMSDSLQPHELQHARLPCLSLSFYLPEFAQAHVHRVGNVIQPSSLWCPFSSCPQSFPESGSFPMSQLFASGGQSIGASASVFPVNIQDWFPLWLTGLSSLQSKGLSTVFSNTTTLWCSDFFTVQFSHLYMTFGKTTGLTIWTFVSKIMSLIFNMLSKLVISFFQGATIF